MPSNLREQNGLPLHTNINLSGSTENLTIDLGDGAHYSLGTTQVLSLSATAQSSSAIGVSGSYKQIRVVGTSAFHLTSALAPTASSASPYFPANIPEIINIAGGNKISVIQDAATGNFFVTQISYP